MGLRDRITSTVLTRFKADVSDHKSKIKSLSAAEKRRNKELVSNLKKEGEGLQKQVVMWGKVAAGIAAVGVAVQAGRKAFNKYSEDVQLRTAAAGVNIDKLRNASHGLLTEQELLSFSAAVMNSDFRITQDQMEDTVGAMISLRNQGNDLVTVQRELTKALVEGKGRGLEQFGVQLGKVSKGAESHAAILERVREETEKMGAQWALSGDDARIAANRMEDAGRRMTVALGKIANELTPVVEGIAALANGLGFVLGGGAGELVHDLVFDFSGAAARADAREQTRAEIVRELVEERRQAAIDKKLQSFDLQLLATSVFASNKEMIREVVAQMTAKERRAARRKRHAADVAAGRVGAGSDRGPVPSISVGEDIGPSGGIPVVDLTVGQGGLGDFAEVIKNQIALNEIIAERVALMGQANEQEEIRAEKIFTLEERFAHMAQKVTVADGAMMAIGASMDTFTAAAAAGMDAFVTGEKGIAQAIKDSLGQSLRGLAVDMQVQAAKHAAYSLGSLAFGNFAGAGQHAIAAGGFQVAALAAGAAARQFGVNQAGGGPAATAAPQIAGGGFGAAAAPADRNFNIFVGEGFEDDSPRRRASRLRSAVERAERRDGGQGTVVFS